MMADTAPTGANKPTDYLSEAQREQIVYLCQNEPLFRAVLFDRYGAELIDETPLAQCLNRDRAATLAKMRADALSCRCRECGPGTLDISIANSVWRVKCRDCGFTGNAFDLLLRSGGDELLELEDGHAELTELAHELEIDPIPRRQIDKNVSVVTASAAPIFKSELTGPMPLPFTYDASARCPKFDRFLAEIQPDPDMRKLIQECAGYSCTLKTNHEVLMLLNGAPNTGKTTLMNIFGWAWGPANCSHIVLKQFAQTFKFYRAIEGKRANIVDEADFTLFAQDWLKALVTGTPAEIPRTNGAPFAVKPNVKLWFNTNELPPVKGREDGVWRRLKLLPFGVRFTEHTKNIALHDFDYWRDELPGVFNWMLAGLERLNANGFTEPAQSAQGKAAYQASQMQGPVKFLQANFEGGTSADYVAADDIYREYCQNGNPDNTSAKKFGEAITTLLHGVSVTKRVNGVPKRVWACIKRRAVDRVTDSAAA